MVKFESIQKHLALIVSIGSLAFAFVVGVLAYAIEYRAQFRQARELQDQLVVTVQSSAAIAAFVGNREIASEVTEGLLANPIIAAVEILSPNGFRHGRARQEGETGDELIYPLLSPVDNKDRIGELRVRQAADQISQRSRTAAQAYAGLLIVQIAISAALLMFLFGRVVGRPLTFVARQLESVPPGGHERISVPRGHERDEIGMLVHSSNSLLAAAEEAILKERRLQAEMDQMAAHYRRIFDTTNVGIMILGPDGSLLNCNSTLMPRIVGMSLDAVGSSEVGDFIGTVFLSPDKAWAMVREAWQSGQPVASDLQLRSHEGQERWAHCMISVSIDDACAIEMIEGVLYDVTARRQRESEARRAAEIDLLTGLANRRGMELCIDRSIRLAESTGVEFGIMLLDLDGFKAVNDTYGHAAGDTVLKVVGQRLESVLRRANDLVARLGGDEFTVVVFDSRRHPDLLEQIGKNILKQLALPIGLDSKAEAQIGASIGIASFPRDGQTREQLINAADAAMYAVKRSGKNGLMLASGVSFQSGN